MKDIDARPIKKIAEAKARKKRKVSYQYHTYYVIFTVWPIGIMIICHCLEQYHTYYVMFIVWPIGIMIIGHCLEC